MSIGFYYNCFKNKYATEQILIQTRKIYPENPIFLMSDNGLDFSDLANKYNCKYYYSKINILGGRMIDNKKVHCFTDEKCAKEFLKIISMAIDYCNTEYIILLEDDVFIHNKLSYLPIHSGGNPNKNYFKCLTINKNDTPLFEKYPNIKYNYWNLAGGSIIKCEILKDCIKKTNFEEIKTFDNICIPNHEFWHTNDVILSYLLMINGFTTESWTNTKKSNISHPYKRFYKSILSVENGVYRK